MSFTTTTVGAAVLAGGVLLGLPGATASADPGLHVAVGPHSVGFGAGSASATKGNIAVGMNGGTAAVTTAGKGNIAIANGASQFNSGGVFTVDATIGDSVITEGKTANHNIVVTNHSTGVIYGGNGNHVNATGGSAALVADGNGNHVNASAKGVGAVSLGDNNTVKSCNDTMAISAQSNKTSTSPNCS
jgi:hypothetical protein